MFNQLSILEKFAAGMAALILAVMALLVSLKINLSPSYPDFIASLITFSNKNKLQDFLAIPAFLFTICGTFIFFCHIIKKVKLESGEINAVTLSNQIIWWSVPAIAIILSQILSSLALDKMFFFISVFGMAFIALTYLLPSKNKVNPEILGFTAFALLLMILIPVEVSLILGRIFNSFNTIDFPYYVKKAIYGLIVLNLLAGVFFVVRHPEKLSRFLPKLLLLAQIGLPFIFLTLFPAQIIQTDGVLTEYPTTIGLKIFIFGLITWGVADVIYRYRRYDGTTSWSTLLSPVALFAVLASLRIANTVEPSLNPDDYHFGESLLGFWSYLQGAIPYVDYIPAHGMLDDDINLFLSWLFYDGTAASIPEASRISFTIIALIAFMSLYWFSGSITLAFISIFCFSGKISWLFFAPFLCLWFSPALRAQPIKWLSVWILSAPIIILAVPPQGILLIAASSIMAAYYGIQVLRSPAKQHWTPLIVSLIIIAIFAVILPLIPMLTGAIQYILENGPINQIAYGIPWSFSWNPNVQILFEAARMAWIIVPIICILMFYTQFKNSTQEKTILLPLVVVSLFILLSAPYSMGRIDAGYISRPGLITIFSWAILFPVAVWGIINPRNRIMLMLSCVCMCSVLQETSTSFSILINATTTRISMPPLTDGASHGLPNVGKTYTQSTHWEQLLKLNALLNEKLAPGEPYLDLTSKNARYFYFNRKPVTPVTATYNMVPLTQQKEAVKRLSANLPKIALLESKGFLGDESALAIRNPYLYRFVIDNYIPKDEQGVLIAYSKEYALQQGMLEKESPSQSTTLSLSTRNFSDSNWNLGIHRNATALFIEGNISLINKGDQVIFANGDTRTVQNVNYSGSSIGLDGPTLDPAVIGYPHKFTVAIKTEGINQHALLFDQAFSVPDLQNIPVVWGNSASTLENKMTLVKNLDDLTPSLHQLSKDGTAYTVDGPESFISFDLADLNLSGHDAGILKFDFNCINKNDLDKIKISWWGDEQTAPSAFASLRFAGENGTLIVPLDTSAFWLMQEKLKGIRIQLDNAAACGKVEISNIGLFNRTFD